MVTSCCAYGCTERFKKGSGIKFHKFPKDDTIKKKWVIALRRQSFIPTDSSFICSKHFVEADYYINLMDNKTLKKGAVPSVFVFTKQHSQRRPLKKKELQDEISFSSDVPESVNTDMKSESSLKNRNIHSENYSSQPSTSFQSQRGLKRKRQPCYCGDFQEEDLECPKLRRKYWTISQNTIIAQRRTIKYYEMQKRRLKKKLNTLNGLINQLRQTGKISQDCATLLENSLPAAEKQLIFKQLRQNTSKAYPPQLRAFALTLHFYSAAAYNYVRNTFGNCLPHESTLRKWYSSVDGSPGYTSEALRAIKVKVSEMEEQGKKLVCSLIMDEMAIREYVAWDGKQHIGYIDYGIEGVGQADNLPKAKEALVFLIVALNSRWKIPVGYFLLNGLSAEDKANLIHGCLLMLKATGVLVKALTFDGTSTNLSVAASLKTQLSMPLLKPYFKNPHDGSNIHIVLDACHMLKLCRNTLGDWGSIFDREGRKIEWRYFVKLVELQETKQLHLSTKIRRRHLNYNAEKMKVKLAVQVFSASVADALNYCKQKLNLPEFTNCEGTAHFCRMLNNIFDVLNTRNMLGKTMYKRPLNPDNILFMKNFISDAINYIENLQCNDGTPVIHSRRKTGFLGIIVSLKSLLNLYTELVDTSILSFLLSYKLSQDHIELFFSAIRSRGGFNNNPTALQFRGAYKRLLVHAEIKTSSSANCLSQDQTSILHVSSNNKMPHSSDYLLESIIDSKNFNRDSIEENMLLIENCNYIYNIVEYIAGFVCKKLYTHIHCDTCKSLLISVNNDNALSFIKFINKGGLLTPAKDVLRLCKVAESCFRSLCNYSRANIVNLLVVNSIRNININGYFTTLNEHILEQDALNNHLLQLIKLILKTYHTIRLNYKNSTINEIEKRVRHVQTKLIHFKHQ